MGTMQQGLVAGMTLLLVACDSGTQATSGSSTINHASINDEVVLSGEVFYPERVALPDDSILLVEVRSDPSPNATLLADERERLEGRQVPIPFRLRVGTEQLATATNPILRTAITSRSGGIRVTEAISLGPDLSTDTDLGMHRLLAITQVSFGTAFRCGPHSVVVSQLGRQQRMVIDAEEVFDLEPLVAASGARFSGRDGDGTEFWNKGDQATITVRGRTFPPCQRVKPPELTFAARGHEPTWHLRIGDQSVILRANYGQQHLHLPPATTITTAAGVSFISSNDEHDLNILVVPEVCHDSMSGMPFPYRVSYRLDGHTYTGCGGETREMLLGRVWNVTELNELPLVPGSSVSIEFREENHRVAGQSTCNQFLGGFSLGGEGLSVGPIATTRQACLNEDLATQEQQFLEAMAAITLFDIDTHGRLILLANGQPRIVAEPIN